MPFNSLLFLVSFSIFYPIFLLTPWQHKWKIFLLASWIFYAAFEPLYLLLLFFITGTDFFVARAIYRSTTRKKRKAFLWLALVANIGVLAVFKYLGLFDEIIRIVSSEDFFWNLSILLPIGISFYTFQGLSYVIDVYRKNIVPEKRLGIFALYISAFPQLIAGPIERAEHLIPQLKKKLTIKDIPFREASFLILIGFTKKLVIADNIGKVVDIIYRDPGAFDGLALMIATLFFGFQIYCDFSGYVDIARGLGKLLGIDFTLNFNKPYFSLSITEFWRRWHISLSNWVRDYLYIPLGGNRKGEIRQYVNLLITMGIMGLWHGAGFPFILWGVYHGLLLALHKMSSKMKPMFVVPIFVKMITTFLLVQIGWIFFRAESIGDVFIIFEGMLDASFFNYTFFYEPGILLGIFLIIGLVIFEAAEVKYKISRFIYTVHPVYLGFLYAVAVHGILFFRAQETLSFIYFQF